MNDDVSRSAAPTPACAAERDVRAWLAAHAGWQLIEGKLERTLRFAGFQESFGFMTSVALAAEALNHHPEWFNVYDTVRIRLSTHDAGGITARDFALAERVDALARSHGAR